MADANRPHPFHPRRNPQPGPLDGVLIAAVTIAAIFVLAARVLP